VSVKYDFNQGHSMRGFIEGENLYRTNLFPDRVDNFVDINSMVRVIDAFVEGFEIPDSDFQNKSRMS
jgi:hypothetical protein